MDRFQNYSPNCTDAIVLQNVHQSEIILNIVKKKRIIMEAETSVEKRLCLAKAVAGR